MRCFLAAVMLLCVFGSCETPPPVPPPTPPPADVRLSVDEAAVLVLHNDVRRQVGLPELVLRDKLLAAARSHAKWMAANKRMSHTGDGGSAPKDRIQLTGYRYSTCGENIAHGYTTPGRVMTGWIGSPGHYRNITNSGYTQIGVAEQDRYWCVVFARPATGSGSLAEPPAENFPGPLSSK